MRDTTITKIEDLDAQDAAFVADYITTRERNSQPQVGDFLEFLDGKILRILDGGGERLDTCLSWNGDLGEVHISPHGARFGSYSRGSGVPRDLVKTTDKVLPGIFSFVHHQGAAWDSWIRIEIPCRVFRQAEGVSRLMVWTICGRVASSIHGYRVKEEQRWEAKLSNEGGAVLLGEFPDRFDAERACVCHLAAKQKTKGRRLPWARHGYYVTLKKTWQEAFLERDGQTIALGEFSKASEAQEACERHHLTELGLSEKEINTVFAVRLASRQAAGREHRSKIAKEAAATRGRRRERKIYEVIKKLGLGHKYGPASRCVVCGKGLGDPESIERGIGSDCYQLILRGLERQKANPLTKP